MSTLPPAPRGWRGRRRCRAGVLLREQNVQGQCCRIESLGPAEDLERGSILLYLLPIALVLLLFAGLVFDGGTALAARGRAADLAAQAARAGADALNQAALRSGGPGGPTHRSGRGPG